MLRITGSVHGHLRSILQFDSWEEWLQASEQGAPRGGYRNADMIKLARGGWAWGAQQVKEFVDRIDSAVQVERGVHEMMAYGVVGPGTIDMGRFIQGHPEAWQVRVPDPTSSRGHVPSTTSVTICFDIATSSAFRYGAGRDVFTRGALVCALIDVLERAGTRVELEVIDTGLAMSGNEATFRTIFKHANEPVDLDRLAVVLCHRDTLGAISFPAYEMMRAWEKVALSTSVMDEYRLVENMTWAGENDEYRDIALDHERAIVIPGVIRGEVENPDDMGWIIDWLKATTIPYGVHWDLSPADIVKLERVFRHGRGGWRSREEAEDWLKVIASDDDD